MAIFVKNDACFSVQPSASQSFYRVPHFQDSGTIHSSPKKYLNDQCKEKKVFTFNLSQIS